MSSSQSSSHYSAATGSALASTNNINLPSQDERDRAVNEAKECIDAMAFEGYQLDGFNLLGVVANPRGGGSSSSSSYFHTATTSSQDNNAYQQQQTPGTETATVTTTGTQSIQQSPATGSASTEQPGIFSDAVQTFEDTMAQVTEQIQTLNIYLGELSRQYLGDDTEESLFLEYYYQDDEDTSNLAVRDVPPELADLQLQDLQYYLEECGVLAHTLRAQGLDTRTLVDEDVIDEEKLNQQLEDIPSLFYETEFDLTDARTFAELLLRRNDDDGVDNNKNNQKTNKKAANSLYQPAHELVPVREQEFLAEHLDRVELALQEQVRQKSTAFFQETTRFRQLQSSIEDLLKQVQQLRNCLQQALGVYRQTKDISDHQRQDYEQLIDLLDGSMELVRCKASIGGLLSANDHLGAVQQIRYGRKLLQGNIDLGSSSTTLTAVTTTTITSNNESIDSNNFVEGNSENATDDDDDDLASERLELQLLTSLSTCGDQFTQYESLVIQNLSEELVEIFFNWRPNHDKDRVQETMEALRICDAMNKTSELYQRRLQQMIRMTVRTTIAEFVESNKSGGSGGVTGMTYPAFYNCLQLLIEEIESILKMAYRVDEFCSSEGIFEEESGNRQQQQQRWTKEAVAQGSDLATKSIAELLRLRKESHSLITLTEMKQLWDTCIQFTTTMEGYSNNSRAVNLRSTLVGQAKAFLDRTHESNMSALVAALDSERWSQCEVSLFSFYFLIIVSLRCALFPYTDRCLTIFKKFCYLVLLEKVSLERQSALTRLCTGLATVSTPLRNLQEGGDEDKTNKEKNPVAVVEGVHYKVVWSCLLMVESIMTYISTAAYFQQSLATNAVTKVVEVMRLFNARTTNLVLGAGAIHSAAKLKSINAKHLSYVTQCLGMMMSLLPHIRAALMAQLPDKQHTLLADVDNIKKEYKDHNEKVLNKFVSIIGGIVEHGLGPRLASIDFDARARDLSTENKDEVDCCVFLDGTSSSTRKLHHVLNSLLPPDHLQDVFSRIFAHLDQKIPALFVAAASATANVPHFSFPTTDDGKHRLLLEVSYTTKNLNSLNGVHPWDFTAMNVLERKIDFKLPPQANGSNSLEEQPALSNDSNEPTYEDTGAGATVIEKEATVETATRENENGEQPVDEVETLACANEDDTIPPVKNTEYIDATSSTQEIIIAETETEATVIKKEAPVETATCENGEPADEVETPASANEDDTIPPIKNNESIDAASTQEITAAETQKYSALNDHQNGETIIDTKLPEVVNGQHLPCLPENGGSKIQENGTES
jgi:vacuolar protein sorting-associated protein 54